MTQMLFSKLPYRHMWAAFCFNPLFQTLHTYPWSLFGIILSILRMIWIKWTTMYKRSLRLPMLDWPTLLNVLRGWNEPSWNFQLKPMAHHVLHYCSVLDARTRKKGLMKTRDNDEDVTSINLRRLYLIMRVFLKLCSLWGIWSGFLFRECHINELSC